LREEAAMGAGRAASTGAIQTRGRDQGAQPSWPQLVVRWLFGLGQEQEQPALAPSLIARFQNICVSREAGSGAGALARLVGQHLRWKVYDEELVEAIAHRMALPIDDVRALDEQAPTVLQDWLLPLREEYYAPQEAYLDHLAKLIEAIGRAGEAILVGRGAGFMLPRETTLSVRVVAPLKVRAQRLAERMGVSLRTARRAARDLDRRRAQFDRTMHRANVNDPHNYDLVLDTDSLGMEIAAGIIVHAVESGRPQARAAVSGLRGLPEPPATRPEPPAAPPEVLTASTEPIPLSGPDVPPAAAKPAPHDEPGDDARTLR
jgi:cytidylate kinase